MKKIGKIIAVAALAMVSYSASAELAPQWTKGTMVGNLNVGASLGYVDFGTTLSLDYVLVDEWWMGHFTVGGIIGVSSYKFSDYDKYKYTIASPRCTYGLNITDAFEVHATVSYGLCFAAEKEKDPNNNTIKSNHWYNFSETMVGCRYFFNDNLAVMAETGYSNVMPELRVGVSYKF